MTPGSLPRPDDIARGAAAQRDRDPGVQPERRPSVVINAAAGIVAVRLFDRGEKLGMADYTASALMRGTARRSFQEIYDLLESAGASLGSNGGTHTTSFGGRALGKTLICCSSCLPKPAPAVISARPGSGCGARC